MKQRHREQRRSDQARGRIHAAPADVVDDEHRDRAGNRYAQTADQDLLRGGQRRVATQHAADE